MNETTAKPVWEWDLNALSKTSGSYTITDFLASKCIALVGAATLLVL
jgi:hypothetical protein